MTTKSHEPAMYYANNGYDKTTELHIEITGVAGAGKTWITEHIAQHLKSIGMNVTCKDEDKLSDYFFKDEPYPAQHKSNVLITTNQCRPTQAEKFVVGADVTQEL